MLGEIVERVNWWDRLKQQRATNNNVIQIDLKLKLFVLPWCNTLKIILRESNLTTTGYVHHLFIVSPDVKGASNHQNGKTRPHCFMIYSERRSSPQLLSSRVNQRLKCGLTLNIYKVLRRLVVIKEFLSPGLSQKRFQIYLIGACEFR
jgi:hypothetical protein